MDDVARELELIKAAITQTTDGNPADVNSVIQLLAIKPAVRPNNIEISSEASVILASIKDLANRMSSLEATQAITKSTFKLEPNGRYVVVNKALDSKRTKEIKSKLNDLHQDIGDEMYIDDKKVGILAEFTINGVNIRKPNGELLEIHFTDDDFLKLSPIPF